MTLRTKRILPLLGLVIVTLAGCASDNIDTGYLKARAEPALKVPAGLEVPAPTNNEAAIPNLSPQDLKALQPQQLFRPPQFATANAQADSGQGPSRGASVASLKTDSNGAAFLQIALSFDEAWSRVRLGLMSSGFTMTDMNRSTGQFFIRYRDPSAGKGSPDQYVLNLLDMGNGSRLLVRSQDGKILGGEVARNILTVVSENL